MSTRTSLLLPLLAVFAAPSQGSGQSGSGLPVGFPERCAPEEVQVMLLGTYHMANPGRDAIKTKADDVLEPTRQAQIARLVDRLARWQPQQIALEAPYVDSTRVATAYQQYRGGTLAPNRNETVQIGYRLAHRLGHDAVFPIDYPLGIGNDSIGPLFARRADLKAIGDALQQKLQQRADSEAATFRSLTVLEQLYAMNTDSALHAGNSEGMFGSLMPAGDGANYGGPDIIAKWYSRNIRMVHHLHRVLRGGTARVLLLVGAGHVPALRNILDEDPRFCPVSPLPHIQ